MKKNSLCLSFPICKMRIIIPTSLPTELLQELNELTYGKGLEQLLEDSKHSINLDIIIIYLF